MNKEEAKKTICKAIDNIPEGINIDISAFHPHYEEHATLEINLRVDKSTDENIQKLENLCYCEHFGVDIFCDT